MSAPVMWEEVDMPNHAGWLWRVRTPTGWLVREVQGVQTLHQGTQQYEQGHEWRSSITFVPDPDGLWLVEGGAK